MVSMGVCLALRAHNGYQWSSGSSYLVATVFCFGAANHSGTVALAQVGIGDVVKMLGCRRSSAYSSDIRAPWETFLAVFVSISLLKVLWSFFRLQ